MKRILTIAVALLSNAVFAQSNVIITFAGNGSPISGVDGGSISGTTIGVTCCGLFDKHGNYFFLEPTNNKVRKISTLGIVTTVAGTGTSGYNGDGILATTSKLSSPKQFAVDTFGNLYIPDAANHRVRKVDMATGIITTIAGNGIATHNGDGGPAVNASISYPSALCIDNFGNIYVAESGYNVIRKIDPTGTISTYAGNGTIGESGDGGPAIFAEISAISGMFVDNNANLYLACSRIRMIDAISGVITTIAGGAVAGFSGDGGPATAASLYSPGGLGFDKNGLLYILDTKNNRIRRVGTDGIINTIIGTGVAGFYGDGGIANMSHIYWPTGITFDYCGDLYFNDMMNYRIRKVDISSCEVISVVNYPANIVTILPNPFTDVLKLTTTDRINTIAITNLIGQTVFNRQCNGLKAIELELRYLPAGIYVVMVNGLYTGKMVKGE